MSRKASGEVRFATKLVTQNQIALVLAVYATTTKYKKIENNTVAFDFFINKSSNQIKWSPYAINPHKKPQANGLVRFF